MYCQIDWQTDSLTVWPTQAGQSMAKLSASTAISMIDCRSVCKSHAACPGPKARGIMIWSLCSLEQCNKIHMYAHGRGMPRIEWLHYSFLPQYLILSDIYILLSYRSELDLTLLQFVPHLNRLIWTGIVVRAKDMKFANSWLGMLSYSC